MKNENPLNPLTKGATRVEFPTQKTESLLELIRGIRARAGDGLEDEEFAFFLQGRNLPEDSGFTFMCFHDGCVTLAVPPQDGISWDQSGWIAPAKEIIGVELAQKHGLILSAPPDAPPALVSSGAWEYHHHLRLSNRKETLIIAHPEFLKIRLYDTRMNLDIPLAPELLKELSALYKQGEARQLQQVTSNRS
jgi:hypothetical protein